MNESDVFGPSLEYLKITPEQMAKLREIAADANRMGMPIHVNDLIYVMTRPVSEVKNGMV
jgi:hypothetical protein